MCKQNLGCKGRCQTRCQKFPNFWPFFYIMLNHRFAKLPFCGVNILRCLRKTMGFRDTFKFPSQCVSKRNLSFLLRFWPYIYVKATMLSDMTEMPTVALGNYILQIELEELKPEVKEIARKELRETPDVAKAAIKELKELLKEETDLHIPLENELWLIRFLRPTKFYPESARDLIKRYYAFKVKHCDMYDGLLPSKERNIFQQNILTVQPNRDQFGRRILIIELGKKWKTDKVSLDEVFKGCVLFLEAAMLEPETQVCGAVVIFDMDGLSLSQTTKFTPSFAGRIVNWLQDSVPLRIKNIHIVNQPYIFKIVFSLFKPFLREKLRNRIIFHGTDRKSLHQYMCPSSLPECYGGTLDLPRIDGEQWLELLEKCDKEFRAINSYGYINKKAVK